MLQQARGAPSLGIVGSAAAQGTVVPDYNKLADNTNLVLKSDVSQIISTEPRTYDATITSSNESWVTPYSWSGFTTDGTETQLQFTFATTGWTDGKLVLQIPVRYDFNGVPIGPTDLWGPTMLLPYPEDYGSWYNHSEFVYANFFTNILLSIGKNSVNPNSSVSMDITAIKTSLMHSPWFKDLDEGDIKNIGLPFGQNVSILAPTVATPANPFYGGGSTQKLNQSNIPQWMRDAWSEHVRDVVDMLRQDIAAGSAQYSRVVYLSIPLHRMMPCMTNIDPLVLPPGTPITITLRTLSATAANSQTLFAIGGMSALALNTIRRLGCTLAPGTNNPPRLLMGTRTLAPNIQNTINTQWMTRDLHYPIYWFERSTFQNQQPDSTGRFIVPLTFNQQQPLIIEIVFMNNTRSPVKAYAADAGTVSYVGPWSPYPVYISKLTVTRTNGNLAQFDDIDDLYQVNAPAGTLLTRGDGYSSLFETYTRKRSETINRNGFEQTNLYQSCRSTTSGTRFRYYLPPAITINNKTQGMDPGSSTITLSFTAKNLDNTNIDPTLQQLTILRVNTSTFTLAPSMDAYIINWPYQPSATATQPSTQFGTVNNQVNVGV